MKKLLGLMMVGTGVLALNAGALAAQEVTLQFMYTDDNPVNVERFRELSAQFDAENDDIAIEFIPAGHDTIRQQLPLQLEVGEGPDLAKLTDILMSRFAMDIRPYLSDPEAFAELYSDTSFLLRNHAGADPDGIYGFMATQTLNMPFVNVTLFEQAGVPLPEPGSSLAQIVEASVKVAEATGVSIPFTLDRSGHRMIGPVLSAGAKIFNDDGTYDFPDQAAKDFIAELYGYTESGAFPKQMWGAAGGSAYKSMGEEFVAGNVVTYLSGNWMIGTFNDQIGDAFDWTAIQAPCGPGGCVAMAGGTAILPFAHSEHPAELARFIEFLGSADVQRKLAEEFIVIPGAKIDNLVYNTDNHNVQNAMTTFVNNRDSLTELARRLQIAKGNTAFFNVMMQRMSQLIVGELTLEETYDAMAKDIASVNAEITAQ